MKKNRGLELNRKQYQLIRKMDHNQMQECVSGFYDEGYRAGYAAARQQAPEFDTIKALDEIYKIKGIGAGRIEEIHKALISAGAESAAELQNERNEEIYKGRGEVDCGKGNINGNKNCPVKVS